MNELLRARNEQPREQRLELVSFLTAQFFFPLFIPYFVIIRGIHSLHYCNG